MLNNCLDCVQNVYSKKLLSTHYNYINLQFYTSAAALVVQARACASAAARSRASLRRRTDHPTPSHPTQPPRARQHHATPPRGRCR